METYIDEVITLSGPLENYDSSFYKKELERLCRLCGNSSNQLIPIFTGDGAEHNLSEKIKEHLPVIEILENDSLPSNICYQCASTLISWHELYHVCKNADQRLKKIKKFVNRYENYVETNPVNESKNQINDSLYTEEKLKTEIDVENHGTDTPNFDQITKSPTSNILLTKDDNMLNTENDELSNDENRCSVITILSTDMCDDDEKGCVISDNSIKENSNNTVEKIFDVFETDVAMHTKNTKNTIKKSLFRCYKCGRSYQNEINLKIHSNEERIICASPYIFHTLYKLMRSHPLLPPEKLDFGHSFECGQCDQRFECKQNLKIHIFCYHACIKKFKCDYCVKKFITECDLAEHRREHSAKMNLICSVCGGRRPNGTILYEIDISRIGFELCQCRGKKEMNLAKKEKKVIHSFNENDVQKKLSSRMNRSFISQSETENEYLTKLPIDKNDEWKAVCDECGKKYSSWYQLKLHRRSHRNRINCDVCGKSYSKHYIHTHKLIHGQEKKFICDTCGKSFAQFSSLSSHRKLEMNFKKFICNFCGLQFVLSSRLQSHLKTHMETQPFKCDHCDKQFGYVWQLRQHSIKHSDVRSFFCEKCAKAYKTSRHLKQHYAVHRKD